MDNKEVRFADAPPKNDDVPGARSHFATHAQVIAALAAEKVEWQKLACAGWPQLPYTELMKLPELPPTPLEELRKIKDSAIRKDALRARRESDDIRAKELAAVEVE